MYVSPNQMDGTLAGIFFLVAIVLWVLAAGAIYRTWDRWPVFVALGLALFAVPFCYNAFVA